MVLEFFEGNCEPGGVGVGVGSTRWSDYGPLLLPTLDFVVASFDRTKFDFVITIFPASSSSISLSNNFWQAQS